MDWIAGNSLYKPLHVQIMYARLDGSAIIQFLIYEFGPKT